MPGQQAWEGNYGNAAGAVGLGFLVPYAGAQLMTNARFVNWLAGATQSVARVGPNSLGPWLGRLAQIGAQEEDIGPDVQQLLKRMLTPPPEQQPVEAGR